MDAQNTDQVEPQPHAAMEVRKHFSQNALAKRSVGSANGIQLTKHAIRRGQELNFCSLGGMIQSVDFIPLEVSKWNHATT